MDTETKFLIYRQPPLELPSQNVMPGGPWKYIFLDGVGAIFMFLEGKKVNHADYLHRLIGAEERYFNPSRDDAGNIALIWPHTREKIEAVLDAHASKLNAQQLANYRIQLEATTVTIRALGSDTLDYKKPNPISRIKFTQFLGVLFPQANITEDQK